MNGVDINTILMIIVMFVIVGISLLGNWLIQKRRPTIPKPNVRFRELKDPPNKINFIIRSRIEEPEMKNYLSNFKVFYSTNGKKLTTVIPGKPKLQTDHISKGSEGNWTFDNFLNDLRNIGANINGIRIKTTFNDDEDRKYCYCVRLKPTNFGDWEKASKKYDNFVKYKYWKCLYCRFGSKSTCHDK